MEKDFSVANFHDMRNALVINRLFMKVDERPTSRNGEIIG